MRGRWKGASKLQILRPSLGLKLFEVEYHASVSDLTKAVRSKLLKTSSGAAVANSSSHEHFLVEPCSGERFCTSQPQLDGDTGPPTPPSSRLCLHMFLRPLHDHHKYFCKGNSLSLKGTVWIVQRNISAFVKEREALIVRTRTFCIMHQHELSILEKAFSRGK